MLSDNWEAYLKPEEREELDAIAAAHSEASAKRRAIYLKCWKRMKRAKAKKEKTDGR